MGKILYKILPRSHFFSFPTARKDARDRDFETPDIAILKLGRDCQRRREREKSLISTDEEQTNGQTHERKRGEQPTQRLNKRNEGQNQHSDQHYMTSRCSSKSQLSVRSSTLFLQHWNDVTIMNLDTKNLPCSARTRTTDCSRRNRVMYIKHQPLMKDQK